MASADGISVLFPTAWWLSHPSEKYECQIGSSSQLLGNIKNVPNRQPANLVSRIFFPLGSSWGGYHSKIHPFFQGRTRPRPSNHKLCPNEHPSTLKSSNMPIGKSPKMVILMGQWMSRSLSIAMFDCQSVYQWQWSYTEKKPQLYLNWLEFPTPPILVFLSRAVPSPLFWTFWFFPH